MCSRLRATETFVKSNASRPYHFFFNLFFQALHARLHLFELFSASSSFSSFSSDFLLLLFFPCALRKLFVLEIILVHIFFTFSTTISTCTVHFCSCLYRCLAHFTLMSQHQDGPLNPIARPLQPHPLFVYLSYVNRLSRTLCNILNNKSISMFCM